MSRAPRIDTVPLPTQIGEVRRELEMRERVYKRWVESGKMTQTAADRHIGNMKAVLATLEWLYEGERLL